MQDPTTPVIVPPKCFPYCIVWSPIPIITALIPFIGHLGVCSSHGTIFDFAGGVNRGNFTFGRPTKFVQLNDVGASALPRPLGQHWDLALEYSERVFNGSIYSFLGNNCHNFVAHFLTQIRFAGRSWSILGLAWMMFRHGHFVSVSGALYTWLPFCAALGLACWLLGPARAAIAWLALALSVVTLLLAADAVAHRIKGARTRRCAAGCCGTAGEEGGSEAGGGEGDDAPPSWMGRSNLDVVLSPQQFLVHQPTVHW